MCDDSQSCLRQARHSQGVLELAHTKQALTDATKKEQFHSASKTNYQNKRLSLPALTIYLKGMAWR
jgi:hypothetical protein